MAITISKQPQSTEVMVGKISGTLEVVATGATTYQWKKAKSASSTTEASNVSGATLAAMPLPKDLSEGEYYYFCALGDDSSSVSTKIATVTVTKFPMYMTGAFVHSYIGALDESIQKKFKEELVRTGIEIPNDNVSLRTKQIELFMSVL